MEQKSKSEENSQSQSKIFHRKGFDILRLTKDKLKVTSNAGEIIVTPEILGSIIFYEVSYRDYYLDDPVYEKIRRNGRIYKLKYAIIEFLFHEKGIIREIEIPENLTLYNNYFINYMIFGLIVNLNSNSKRILNGTAHQTMINDFIILKEYVEQVITEYDVFELNELLYDLQEINSPQFFMDEDEDNSLSTLSADEIQNINSYYSDAIKSIQEIAELVKATRDSMDSKS